MWSEVAQRPSAHHTPASERKSRLLPGGARGRARAGSVKGGVAAQERPIRAVTAADTASPSDWPWSGPGAARNQSSIPEA